MCVYILSESCRRYIQTCRFLINNIILLLYEKYSIFQQQEFKITTKLNQEPAVQQCHNTFPISCIQRSFSDVETRTLNDFILRGFSIFEKNRELLNFDGKTHITDNNYYDIISYVPLLYKMNDSWAQNVIKYTRS